MGPTPEAPHGFRKRGYAAIRACEVVVVGAAAILVMLSVLMAAVVLYALFIDGVRSGALTEIASTAALQKAAEQVFAGVLLLLLGLELLKSLTSFFVGHHLQLEIIVVVSMIAVARHIMLVDFAHVDAANVLGAAALVLALAISYALVRQPLPASSEPHA